MATLLTRFTGSSTKYEPHPRCFHVSHRVGNKVLVQGGLTKDFSEKSRHQLTSVVEIFDPYSELWEQKQVTGDIPPPGTYNAASASLHDNLFRFGGGDGKNYFNTLHKLDTQTWRWCQLSPPNAKGAPIPKGACGMISFGDNLGVFGGYGIPWGPSEPMSFVREARLTDGSGWTDELHIFHLKEGDDHPPLKGDPFSRQCTRYCTAGVWSCPSTTGERPPPCSGFTFTAIDDRRAVLFGGKNKEQGRMNDVYIIDLHTMYWTKSASTQSRDVLWPAERGGHAACCLNYGQQFPQLLVSGGLDAQAKPLADIWILDVERACWRKVCDTLKYRWGHSLTAISLGPGLTELAMFGGSSESWNGSEDKQSKLADTTLLQFRLVESSGLSEWELLSVVENKQRGSQERMIEKLIYTVDNQIQHTEKSGLSRMERRELENERDRARMEKLEVEGERDRARVEKQEAEAGRDRALLEKQEAVERANLMEAAIDGERAEKHILEGRLGEMEAERDKTLFAKQEAVDRIRVLEGERRVEKHAMEETVRAMQDRLREMEIEVQQAQAGTLDLQLRLNEIEERKHERLVVQEQAIAAEQRGPSWEVGEDQLEVTDDRLGVGGWAEVKVAKLKVAAKVLHEQLIYDYHRRLFRREMNVAARVSHPNLLRFLGARLEGGMAILTEIMPTSLRALVNRRPQQHLPLEHILSIAIDVACALNYLHHMTPDPMIHRDLSSANVLLQPTPNGGWLAKVSDYGTANFQSQLQTENPGSPVYTAPESRDPALQTPKMDIYSFGVLLVEMCTCEFPAPERRTELIESIDHPKLFDLIIQCLTTDKDRRPTAAELVTYLQVLQ